MSRLSDVRVQLLSVHRALIDAQRVEFEREHGRVSSGAFLEQVIGSPKFAWLQPMTALIVALDEAIDSVTTPPKDPAKAAPLAPEAVYLADVRALLTPDAEGNEFARQYAAALQASPDVVLAHGAAMRSLAAS